MKTRTKAYPAAGNPANVIVASCEVPDYIRRLERNARARERRFAKKHGCTMREAHVALALAAEEAAQGED